MESEISIFKIVRNMRESQEAMKILLSRNQRKLIRNKCKRIVIKNDSDSDDRDPTDKLNIEFMQKPNIQAVDQASRSSKR